MGAGESPANKTFSHFGEQKGDFSLALRSIAAHRHGNRGNKSADDTASQHPQQSEAVVTKGPDATASKGGWLSWLGSVLGNRR